MTPIFRQKIAGNAWETVEESGGGAGGIEALASFSPIVAHGLTNADFHVVGWTANAPAFGSGIDLNVDTQTVDLDDGWYQIAVMLTVSSDSNNVMDANFFISDLQDDPAWQSYGPTGAVPSPSIVQTVVTPPIPFEAATQSSFTVQAYGEHVGNSDAWSVNATGGMRVWRLAVA